VIAVKLDSCFSRVEPQLCLQTKAHFCFSGGAGGKKGKKAPAKKAGKKGKGAKEEVERRDPTGILVKCCVCMCLCLRLLLCSHKLVINIYIYIYMHTYIYIYIYEHGFVVARITKERQDVFSGKGTFLMYLEHQNGHGGYRLAAS
jgi:hypothetical protein